MIYLFPILLPLICLTFWGVQARRRRGRPGFLDVGWVFMMLLLIYGIVPGLGFLLAHLGIGQILDARLAAGFDLSLVEDVQAMFLSFALGFALVHTLVRRFGLPLQVPPGLWRFVWRRIPQPQVGEQLAAAAITPAPAPSCFRRSLPNDGGAGTTRPAAPDHRAQASRQIVWLIPLAVGLLIALAMVRSLFGAQTTGDYASSYTAFRAMPLILQQVVGIATQTSFALLVAAIVFAVAAWPKEHFLVAVLVGCLLAYTLLAGGSRSTAFLCFFAYIAATTVYVPGFSIGKVVALAGAALGLFMFAGLLRDQLSGGASLGLLQSGEFTSVFINAVDLKQRLRDAFPTDSWFAFYFVDLLRLFPSQLVGDIKFDPATWYVQTFYELYYEQGGGLAFGALTESAIGLGVPEAAVRGALLGLVFAWLGNRLIEGPGSVIRVFVYVWLTVLSYQSIRDTTFSLGVRALFQLLPLVVLLVLTRDVRFRWQPVQPACSASPEGLT